jgi:hypothetical protein
MNIRDFVSLIPEDAQSESLMSIQSIVTKPAEKLAIIRCHLSQKFNVEMTVVGGYSVTLSAPGVQLQTVAPKDLVVALSKMIYAADEAISQGRTESNTASSFDKFILTSNPPESMDLPTWDEKAQCWYDAEI